MSFRVKNIWLAAAILASVSGCTDATNNTGSGSDAGTTGSTIGSGTTDTGTTGTGSGSTTTSPGGTPW